MTASNPADQRVWGPHAWHFLHSIAETYDPATARESLLAFMQALPALLPCPVCGDHLRDHLADMNLAEASQTARGVSDFMWELHNRVNADTGKPRWPADAPRIPELACSPNDRGADLIGIFSTGQGKWPAHWRTGLAVLALILIAIAVALVWRRRGRA